MQTFTLEQIEEMDQEYGGFCISCRTEHYNIEPDAREYKCESCSEKKVYGAMEIAMMGLVE